MTSSPRHATATQLVAAYAPLIEGKTVLTTGVSPNSLGSYFVHAIAQARPACLILVDRSAALLAPTAASLATTAPTVRTRTLELNLMSFASIRAAAAQVNEWTDVPAIDVTVNNAGIMAVPEYRLSEDGFEAQLATNYLGPFLFTNLIMPKIRAAEQPRVIMVSSGLHRLGPFRLEDYNFHGGETYHKWFAYGQSKSANMLMALSLAEKLGLKANLLAFSIHPGVVKETNLADYSRPDPTNDGLVIIDRILGSRQGWREALPAKTPDEGVATHVYAAFDPSLAVHNGGYLVNCRPANPMTDTVRPWAISSIEARKAWYLSERLVGQEFAY